MCEYLLLSGWLYAPGCGRALLLLLATGQHVLTSLCVWLPVSLYQGWRCTASCPQLHCPRIVLQQASAALLPAALVSVCSRGGRALLVVPASVVYNWLDEFLRWLPRGSSDSGNADSGASRLTTDKVFLVGERV
jgi:hypothetical protein